MLGRLATAMQFIQQAFELVVVDELVHLFLYRLQRGKIRGTAVLALAVQLIEQSLELVVRDVARAAQHGGGRHRRRLAGTVQFIQQALEFVGGNLVDGAATVDSHRRTLGDDDGFGLGFWLLWGGNAGGTQLLLPFGFAQLVQIMQQIGRGRAGRLPVLHLGKHDVDGIKGLQNDIHQLGTEGSLAVAQHVEQVLGTVADVHQLGQGEETRSPLDGMEAAKDGIQQILVIGPLFQVDQLFRQLFQYF